MNNWPRHPHRVLSILMYAHQSYCVGEIIREPQEICRRALHKTNDGAYVLLLDLSNGCRLALSMRCIALFCISQNLCSILLMLCNRALFQGNSSTGSGQRVKLNTQTATQINLLSQFRTVYCCTTSVQMSRSPSQILLGVVTIFVQLLHCREVAYILDIHIRNM